MDKEWEIARAKYKLADLVIEAQAFETVRRVTIDSIDAFDGTEHDIDKIIEYLEESILGYNDAITEETRKVQRMQNEQ